MRQESGRDKSRGEVKVRGSEARVRARQESGQGKSQGEARVSVGQE